MRYHLYDVDDNPVGTMSSNKNLMDIQINDLTPAAKKKLGIKKGVRYEASHSFKNGLIILEYLTNDGLGLEDFEVIGRITY